MDFFKSLGKTEEEASSARSRSSAGTSTRSRGSTRSAAAKSSHRTRGSNSHSTRSGSSSTRKRSKKSRHSDDDDSSSDDEDKEKGKKFPQLLDSNQTTAIKDKLKGVFTNALPNLLHLLGKIANGFESLEPYADKCMALWADFLLAVAPYNPPALLQIVSGLAMMFFGGYFISTVAVFEAVQQGGSDRLIKNLIILKDQAEDIIEANEADDELDEDNDGIKDVKQISAQELTMRKLMVVFRSCNPFEVNEAFSALYTIMIAVIATLRVQFARTVSLGASLGEQIAKPALKFLVPVLEDALPRQFHKWITPIVKYTCRLIGSTVAFFLQSILTTVHSAVRGSYMLTKGFTDFAESRGMNYLTDGYADDMLSFALAGLGIFAQLFLWQGGLPEVLKILLFPAVGTEYVLSYFITVMVL